MRKPLQSTNLRPPYVEINSNQLFLSLILTKEILSHMISLSNSRFGVSLSP